jgi:hypothetical protein
MAPEIAPPMLVQPASMSTPAARSVAPASAKILKPRFEITPHTSSMF